MVHQDVTLAALDLLAAVESLDPTDLGGLDRLAVQAGRRGLGVVLGRLADRPMQGVVDPLDGAVGSPLAEVAVDGPRRGEIVGQEIPGASGAEVIEDGVEDLSHVGSAGPSAAGRGREQGPEDVPLGVGEVGVVGGAGLGGGTTRRPWGGLGAGHGRVIPVSRRVGSIRVDWVDDDDSTVGLTSLFKLTNPL